MRREIIEPRDVAHWHALRAPDLTSTEIAALFDLSPYATAFELWHRKREGEADAIEETERMFWGKALQDAIGFAVASRQGWRACRRMSEYIRLPDLRLGSSFDFCVLNAAGDPGVLEVKNVDALRFRDGWIVDGDTLEAPEHIELQHQHQLLVSGFTWGAIAALVGGNRVIVFERKPIEAVHNAILIRSRDFWRSIDANEAPAPDFHRDAEALRAMYDYAEPGKVANMRGDERVAEICQRYSEASRIAKNAEEDRKAAAAELLTVIGDAEKVFADGFTISAGVVGPARVEYDRAGYRNLRLFPRKSA